MSQKIRTGDVVKLDAATDVGWWMNVFDALPDATFISHARSGRIQVANKACKTLLGYDIGFMLGRTTMELGMFETKAQRDALVEAALASTTFVESPFWAVNNELKQGQFSICEVEYAGTPTLINIIRDITAEK
ncbi:MAG: PAS domain-containing protein [Gammaproteobacteria bacterium]|nr:PAS domain-containing protein [Gammaproteobacteria bacterium]